MAKRIKFPVTNRRDLLRMIKKWVQAEERPKADCSTPEKRDLAIQMVCRDAAELQWQRYLNGGPLYLERQPWPESTMRFLRDAAKRAREAHATSRGRRRPRDRRRA